MLLFWFIHAFTAYRHYDYEFANYYREALLNWELGNERKVPRAWRQAFSNAQGNEYLCVWAWGVVPFLTSASILIIQHLFLGANAHINNDLAQALAQV